MHGLGFAARIERKECDRYFQTFSVVYDHMQMIHKHQNSDKMDLQNLVRHNS